ncbi:hypothetical protein AWB80_01490 [Caballeronia pedi]|uniref:T4 beta protein n=1 Tax=Caballeronia pedi TaxID=1777141 RepID=A0A157ZYP3_9BURK|nr:beta family protein [Caballeronia pedi]SAK50651.1 hypothetical protein AWB80_01490 [Caballeronia pedi]
MDLGFDSYSYYPALRTRQAELKGLEMLRLDRKRHMLPLLTLGRWPKATDFGRSLEKAAESMEGLPFIVDLTDDGRHLPVEHKTLRDGSGHFKAWRDLTSQFEAAIPVVQMGGNARRRDVAQQARAIEAKVGKVAFRIRDFKQDTDVVVGALNSLDDILNAIVFVDCQYIRASFAAYHAATVSTIDTLRNEFPQLYIVILGTSFPMSALDFADSSKTHGTIDIAERALHSQIGGDAVAGYGDYGSIHSVVYDDATIMRWVPRIDYPRELEWIFERRNSDQPAQGYVECAKALLEVEPDIGSRDIWGEDMIRLAASGTPHAKAPASWISVRVNIHLSKQVDLSQYLAANSAAPSDTEDQD